MMDIDITPTNSPYLDYSPDSVSSTSSGQSNPNPSPGAPSTQRQPRQRLRPWLIDQINKGDIAGLVWLDRDELKFKIPWKHFGRPGINEYEDAKLFRRWALHTKKFREGESADISTWKTRFRCALHKLPDIEELHECNQKDGDNPYRVYRFIKKEIEVEKVPTCCSNSSCSGISSDETLSPSATSITSCQKGSLWQDISLPTKVCEDYNDELLNFGDGYLPSLDGDVENILNGHDIMRGQNGNYMNYQQLGAMNMPHMTNQISQQQQLQQQHQNQQQVQQEQQKQQQQQQQQQQHQQHQQHQQQQQKQHQHQHQQEHHLQQQQHQHQQQQQQQHPQQHQDHQQQQHLQQRSQQQQQQQQRQPHLLQHQQHQQLQQQLQIQQQLQQRQREMQQAQQQMLSRPLVSLNETIQTFNAAQYSFMEEVNNSVEIKLFYADRQVASRIVDNPNGVRIAFKPPPQLPQDVVQEAVCNIYGPINAEQIVFPPTDDPYTALILERITRGLVLQFRDGAVLATRLCQAKVYYSKSEVACNDELPRQHTVVVFDYKHDFLQKFNQYKLGDGERPLYERYFSFAQPWSVTSPLTKNYVRVTLTHCHAQQKFKDYENQNPIDIKLSSLNHLDLIAQQIEGLNLQES